MKTIKEYCKMKREYYDAVTELCSVMLKLELVGKVGECMVRW